MNRGLKPRLCLYPAVNLLRAGEGTEVLLHCETATGQAMAEHSEEAPCNWSGPVHIPKKCVRYGETTAHVVWTRTLDQTLGQRPFSQSPSVLSEEAHAWNRALHSEEVALA